LNEINVSKAGISDIQGRKLIDDWRFMNITFDFSNINEKEDEFY